MTEEEAVDQYMHGYCMYMAAALHHQYGFPIGLFTITHNGEERLSHAWVVTPLGCLDIQGLQTITQVTVWMGDTPECDYRLQSLSTLARLERLAGVKLPADDVDVRQALAMAQEHLRRELSALSSTGRAAERMQTAGLVQVQ